MATTAFFTAQWWPALLAIGVLAVLYEAYPRWGGWVLAIFVLGMLLVAVQRGTL